MKHFYFLFTAALPFIGSAQITTASFGARVDFPSAILQTGTQNLSATDIDGDGKLDMVETFPGPISVYRNTSTVGTINSSSFASVSTDLLITGASWQGQTSDLDGDGKKDVLTSKSDSNPYGFSVFRNTSTIGNISFASEQIFDNNLANTMGLQLADIDGDGKDDIIACDPVRGKIVIMRNTSTVGTINFASEVLVPVLAAGLRKLSVADIDGDGKKDIAAGDAALTKVHILQNTSIVGNVSFSPKVDFTVAGEPYDVSIVDIDGDGHKDIVAACRWQTDQLVVLRSLITSAGTISTSSFATPVGFATGVTGCDPFAVAVGNLDGDSKPDIVVTNNVANTIAVFRNTSSSGSITTSSLATHVDFATLTYSDGVILADIDGDGKNEIIVADNTASSGIGNFSIFRNLIAPTGIDQNEILDKIQLYPNPANSIVTLNGITGTAHITLYDVLGKIILEQQVTKEKTEIDLRELSEGLFFLTIKMENGILVTKKIMSSK